MLLHRRYRLGLSDLEKSDGIHCRCWQERRIKQFEAWTVQFISNGRAPPFSDALRPTLGFLVLKDSKECLIRQKTPAQQLTILLVVGRLKRMLGHIGEL